ncbi:MAG: YolD-like family protein [Acholeplasmatales bacterium]|nr:YolD-like family protein [Acholeplasmatales bacterium]
MEKMSRRDRAKQFLPFNSLRGYYDLIREKEKEVTPKRELSNDDLLELSNKLKEIKKNRMVKITYYDVDSYKTISGLVSKIDFTYKYIVIVKTKISFNDISVIY